MPQRRSSDEARGDAHRHVRGARRGHVFAGAETCDDGNTAEWDGCSADCQEIEDFCYEIVIADSAFTCPTGDYEYCATSDDLEVLAEAACSICSGESCSLSTPLCGDPFIPDAGSHNYEYLTRSCAAGGLPAGFAGWIHEPLVGSIRPIAGHFALTEL